MNYLLTWPTLEFFFFAGSANIWDVAQRIVGPWQLAAFALAIVMFLALKYRRKPVPAAAWIAIVLLVAIPVIATVYQTLAKAKVDSTAIYRVRVTVVGPDETPIENAKVWSTIGGESHTLPGGAQFDIPAATVPQGGQVTIFASQESLFLKGKTDLRLGSDHNPAITIQLIRAESRVRGQIVDVRGKAIAGARVWVVGYGNEEIRTPPTGGFELPAHAAVNQQVQLHAEKAGYKAVSQWHPAGDYPATITLEK